MSLAALALLVEGGIPEGSAVVLNGSPGTGKSTLALQLLADHLEAKGEGILVTTEAAPAQLARRADILGAPLAPHIATSLRFLDAYSWRVGKTPAPLPGVETVASLADLNSLSIKMSEWLDRRLMPNAPLLVVLDTPSTITLHAAPASILKLIEVLFAKVKAATGTVLAPIERDMHEPPFLAALSAMADGVIEFRLVEENDDLSRQMRVLSMRTAPMVKSKWTTLSLTKGGLSVRSS